MSYNQHLELAIDVASRASRFLDDQRLPNETWTVSIWPKENGQFIVWFQVESMLGNNTRKTNSKLLSPTLFSAYSPLDLIKGEIYNALRELRA